MALRHDEDTEFNDALRAHGILPPKPPPERSPSPPPVEKPTLPRSRSPSPDLLELLQEEEELSNAQLEAYREQRIAEMMAAEEKKKFGEMEEIGREDYNRTVVEGSKDHVVVCLLYKDSVPQSLLLAKHLQRLAAIYPSTKFVKIISTRCIANYPDRAVPTMLIYRNQEMLKQIVGLGTENDQLSALRGMKTTVEDIELLLVAAEALDPSLRQVSLKFKNGEDIDDDENDKEIGHTSKGFLGRNYRSKEADDDFEFDM